jgi:sugar lactone lactonase YvrE
MRTKTGFPKAAAALDLQGILLLALAVTVVAGCGGSDDSLGPTPTKTTVTDEHSLLEVVRSYDASADEFPEAITVDKEGNIYVSLARLGQIRKIAPGGTETVVADFEEPKALGVAVDADGNVYCCQHSPNTAVHGIHRVSLDGISERLPGSADIVHCNGLALDDQGNLYVSDSEVGALWQIPPGASAELWLQHDLLEGTGETPGYPPLGANGVAYWQDGLYVANLEKGHVVRIAILKQGLAGDPEVVAKGMYGLDGITVDINGRIYAANGSQTKVVRIDPADGSITELATRADGLHTPSDVAFGMAEGDRQSLLITNYAVARGGSGPAVVKLDLGGEGLPLP